MRTRVCLNHVSSLLLLLFLLLSLSSSWPCSGCAFMPDNEWLLSCSEDSSIRLWHLKSKSMVSAYKTSSDSMHPVWDVACSPLGYYFASASHDKTACLWNPERSAPVRRFVGHLSDVETIAFHPNATMVATGSLDRTVRLWDIRTGNCVRLLSHGPGAGGGTTSIAFSPNGEHVRRKKLCCTNPICPPTLFVHFLFFFSWSFFLVFFFFFLATCN